MKITEEELQEIISNASEQGAKAAIKEMKKQNMFKHGMDTYQKTEYILRNYNEFKRAIIDRQEEISDIETYGIKKKSASITSYPGGTRSAVLDDAEKADEQIRMLQHQNELTKNLINKIDSILDELKDEPYYRVIELYYFEKKKYEVIAGELAVSISTVSSARKQIIEKIKIRLFSDNVIREIFS